MTVNDKELSKEEIMELQKETVQSIAEYLPNLISGMENVVSELKGEMKEDTWEYFRMVIDGFNWVIEAYNGTKEYRTETGKVLDDSRMEEAVSCLSDAFRNKEEEKSADVVEKDILPFLNKLKDLVV